MKDKIIIDTDNSMYPIAIANTLKNKFTALGIPTSLINSGNSNLTVDERINLINSQISASDEPLIISLRQEPEEGDELEIVYALRNSSTLASLLNNELSKEGITVNKYYQRRDEEDTAYDYDPIIRNTDPNQTLIIFLGDLNNNEVASQLASNQTAYVEGIVRAITDYLDILYIPEEGNYHIVKKGESLYSIAKEYGVTVAALKEANNLTSDTLQIGEILKIPEETMIPETPSKPSNLYTVVKGDSLYSIAQKFNTTVAAIKSANNLTSNVLQIGQTLIIPGSSSGTGGTATSTYTVAKGDSLYSIAQKFNTTVDAIKNANNLTSNVLQIGQTLIIPGASGGSTISTYTVVKGDSLYSIAQKFNTTVAAIKNANNLTSNVLQIGQTLIIPGSSNGNSTTTYTVVKGDSLYAIALKFNTTVDAIKNKNNLTSDNLSIGQKLII